MTKSSYFRCATFIQVFVAIRPSSCIPHIRLLLFLHILTSKILLVFINGLRLRFSSTSDSHRHRLRTVFTQQSSTKPSFNPRNLLCKTTLPSRSVKIFVGHLYTFNYTKIRTSDSNSPFFNLIINIPIIIVISSSSNTLLSLLLTFF